MDRLTVSRLYNFLPKIDKKIVLYFSSHRKYVLLFISTTREVNNLLIVQQRGG